MALVKPPVGARLNSSTSLGNGLIYCGLFNEGVGLKVADISPFKATGTLTNMGASSTTGWAYSKFGNTLAFDGTNDAISLGTGLSQFAITGSTPFTFSLWWKTTPNPSAAMFLLCNESQTAPNQGFSWDIRGNAGADPYQMTFRSNPGTVGIIVQYPRTDDALWHHAVITYTGSGVASGFSMYEDGKPLTPTVTNDTLAGNSLAGANIMTIGARQDGAGAPFLGNLDNVRIYNRVLTQAEVSELYRNPFAGISFDNWKKPRRTGNKQQIVFDAASNSGYQAAASSYSWNHTCSGSDRYLVVGISMLSLAQTVSGITYNSVAMTFLGAKNSVSGACRVELWGLKAPSTGTNSIAVTLTGAIASAGNASSYTGVNQTSPIEGFNSAQATNVGAADATVNVTSVADNDWCVDVVATDDAAITVGAGQTQRGNVTGAGGSGAMSTEGPKTPAGSVTMSWTNVGALATWSIASVALRPTAAASLTSNSNFFFFFQ